MAKNFLIQALRENNSKTNYFTGSTSSVSYKTGYPVFDYYLGYRVSVYNEDDTLRETYPSIGIAGGCFVTLIGKPSTGKTTFAVQAASNMVRPFPNGTVLHFDLEQGQNYSRIQNLSRFTMKDMEEGKYILRQDQNSINDIKSSIMQIYREKKSKPDVYKYNTGKLNEFGKEIWQYEPTVVIIDSIPMLSTHINENDKKEAIKLEEVSSQTDRMRLTAEIGRFFTEVTPYIKETNITVISINQIKTNPGMGIIPQAADIMYLKQNESLPGGKAPQFLANYLIRFNAVGSEKANSEEDGYDGFGLRLDIIKSRTNQAGQTIGLVYDKVKGVDSLRSSVKYASEIGRLAGNKNGYYFVNPEDGSQYKEHKFTKSSMHEDFKSDKELYKIMYTMILPSLETRLSSVSREEMEIPEEEFEY